MAGVGLRSRVLGAEGFASTAGRSDPDFAGSAAELSVESESVDLSPEALSSGLAGGGLSAGVLGGAVAFAGGACCALLSAPLDAVPPLAGVGVEPLAAASGVAGFGFGGLGAAASGAGGLGFAVFGFAVFGDAVFGDAASGAAAVPAESGAG